MKYLQKFNESKENYITQSDFELIEDLFLFWSDERPILYIAKLIDDRGMLPSGLMRVGTKYLSQNSIIENDDKVTSIRIRIDYSESNRHNNWNQDQGRQIVIPRDEFSKLFGYTPHSNKKELDKIYTIQSANDIVHRFGPFPENPTTKCQKVLSILNNDYNIKKDLYDILERTKGLEYYGFKWDMALSITDFKFIFGDQKIGFNITIVLGITK